MERKYLHRSGLQQQDSTQEIKSDPGPKLSPANAQRVIMAGWDEGSIHITAHFKARGIEKGFNTIDAGNVIRYGKMRNDGEYCPEYKNWKYRFYGKVEEETLEVVVSLDPTEDYDRPLIIAITGYWR
jgi:hypothetical protein